MGRRREYSDPVVVTLRAERWVSEFFKINKQVKIGRALEEWINATKPRDMSAAEFHIKYLEEKKDREISQHKIMIDEIQLEHEDVIKDLQKKKDILLQQKAKDLNLIRKQWPEFREAYPKVKTKPIGWGGDNTIEPWWGDQGIQLTYGDIHELWDEMEGDEN